MKPLFSVGKRNNLNEIWITQTGQTITQSSIPKVNVMDILTYPSDAAEARVRTIAARTLDADPAVYDNVRTILGDVRDRGDAALLEYTRKFDGAELTPETLRVSPEEIAGAEMSVDGHFMDALNRAIRQIENFHKNQLRKSWINTDRPGTVLGQLFNPVEAAGVYVPGGKGGDTPLVSSVLMGVIPARIAGVDRVVMATPPTAEGKVSPQMLVAAKRAGVDAVYRAGSAWAVGAMAYGTQTVPRCDVIVGPGNIYVTVAKKMVSGAVGIDMIAGPSEVLVIADADANPEFVAADMLSQAEHDPLASAVLVTDSQPLAEKVREALNRQLDALGRADIARKSLADYGALLVVSDLDAAFVLSNRIAPEHLELLVDSPFEQLGKIRNAGAVFMGPYTPEPMGDYIAGPNHVLPTGGTARFSSALSVDNFIKKTSVIHYAESAFREEAPDVIRLAETEGLGAHARSVRVRLED
jgi:histidinol dehydrogenase